MYFQVFNLKTKDFLYSNKEIAAHLNNAVISQKQRISKTAARSTVLRTYTETLIAPVFTHVEEGLLSTDEAAFILSSAALLVFMKLHKIKTLPAQEDAEKVVNL